MNSVEFNDFKRFILELKKLNNEYIEFKNDNKVFLGKPKRFEEFISEVIDNLNDSDFIKSQSNALNGNYFFGNLN